MSSSSVFATRTSPCTRSGTTVSPSRGAFSRIAGLAPAGAVGRVAVAPSAVVARRPSFRDRALARRLQLLRRVEGEVGAALRQQLPRDLGMPRLAPALEHRRLVGRKAEPVQAVQDLLHRVLGAARPVGVLDPQQVLPAMVPREEEVEQRRPRPADVQEAGGRGGESGADGHAKPVFG